MDQVTGGLFSAATSDWRHRGGPTGSASAIVRLRKHHGALFHASAIFPEDAVKIEGETRDYAGRFFCPRCGSPVFGRAATRSR